MGRWVDEGQLLAARASMTGDNPIMVVSSLPLRRFRVVDKAHLFKDDVSGMRFIDALSELTHRGQLDRVKSILEIKLMDAFYREYVMGHDLLCIWALRAVEVEPSWLKLISRLGDTESLCTVLDVEEDVGELYESQRVETCFPAPMERVKEPIEGSYLIVKMCDESYFMDRSIKPREYVIPCKLDTIKTEIGVIPILRPSKVIIKYEEPIMIIKTEEYQIVTYTPSKHRRRKR